MLPLYASHMDTVFLHVVSGTSVGLQDHQTISTIFTNRQLEMANTFQNSPLLISSFKFQNNLFIYSPLFFVCSIHKILYLFLVICELITLTSAFVYRSNPPIMFFMTPSILISVYVIITSSNNPPQTRHYSLN